MESESHRTTKAKRLARPKTGQNRISKTFSLDKRQAEWLDAYQGDSSEIVRQLLDDYIDTSVSAESEKMKLVLRLRMLQRQQEKIGVELNSDDIAGTAIRKLNFARADYDNWHDKTGKDEDEACRISESHPEAYQRELERRKHVLDVAQASFQVFKRNHDALEKEIAEVEAQLVKA